MKRLCAVPRSTSCRSALAERPRSRSASHRSEAGSTCRSRYRQNTASAVSASARNLSASASRARQSGSGSRTGVPSCSYCGEGSARCSSCPQTANTPTASNGKNRVAPAMWAPPCRRVPGTSTARLPEGLHTLSSTPRSVIVGGEERAASRSKRIVQVWDRLARWRVLGPFDQCRPRRTMTPPTRPRPPFFGHQLRR